MASYTTLRNALVTALEAVDDIGTVHDYRRYIVKADEARTAFVTTIDSVEQVAFADVDLTQMSLTPSAWQPSGMRMGGSVTFGVRLLRSLNDGDASSRAFALVVEDAAEAACAAFTGVSPVQYRVTVDVAVNEHRGVEFPGIGGVLCNYAELVVRLDDWRTV